MQGAQESFRFIMHIHRDKTHSSKHVHIHSQFQSAHDDDQVPGMCGLESVDENGRKFFVRFCFL